MKRAAFIGLLGALFLSQCSDRARRNPLDPLNPETKGLPEAPLLSSDNKTIFVSWADMDNTSITGYRVWRRTEGQSEPEPLAVVNRSPGLEYRDTVSHYDTTYTYRVSAITETFESGLSPSDSIVPGPFNYWVADFFTGALSVVTYDGAHLLRREYVDSPVALDLDPGGSSLWLATYYPARITKQTLEGEELLSHQLESFPTDIAVDDRTGDVWIATVGSSDLIRIGKGGGPPEEIPVGLTLSRDSHLDVDPSGDQVWVTVPDSDRVLRISTHDPSQAQTFTVRGFPRGVITTEEPEMTWIATDSGVVGIDPQNEIYRYLKRFSLIDMDVQRESQRVWLLAYDPESRTTTVWTITHVAGVWKTERVDVGRTSFWRIRVNPGSKHPGLLGYDLVQQRLIRLDESGNELGKLGGFSARLDIVIEE